LQDLKKEVVDLVEQRRRELTSMSDWLKLNPEIGHQEYLASWLLSSYAEDEGMTVERRVAGLETAFKATSLGRKNRPVVALMAEYDALPEVGHGCGHNIIAASTVGAAVVLHKIMARVNGSLVLLGCPAEEDIVENAGGKIIMVEKGVFDEIDCAMMVHPSPDVSYMKRSSSMGRIGLQLSFVRHPLSQRETISETAAALSSYIDDLNKDKSFRIIVEKIDKPVDHIDFTMKLDAPEVSTVLELVRRLTSEAEKIAKDSEVSMFHRQFTNTYADMMWNSVLSDAFQQNLIELGEQPMSHIDRPNIGDEGNVSHVVPTICTWIRISDRPLPNHSREFADATLSRMGHDGIMLGAKALAMTAVDIFANTKLLEDAKHEFTQETGS
jgi:metal-dependent amidase/aminoacylase/carboxypeptidase family protein